MGFWKDLACPYADGKTLDKIYRKMAKEDIEDILTAWKVRCRALPNDDYHQLELYYEEAITLVNNYSRKMLAFASYASGTGNERVFSIAHEVAQQYMDELCIQLDKVYWRKVSK